MGSRIPIVRQISWPLVVPQLIAGALAIAVASVFVHPFPRAIIWGGGVYLIYSFGSRALLLQSHRRGISLVRQQRFVEAIDAFEVSYAFFTRHPWLDHYRAITMMMPSAASCREMALLSIAYCYSQLGDGLKTKEYYQRTLAEFPDSVIAASTLNFIESVERLGPHNSDTGKQVID